jgi:hypothetical protein
MPSNVVAPVATRLVGRLASRGGRARTHDPLTVGARTFNSAALEYLQGCSCINPGPAERAEQLKEVQRLTTLPGKSAAGYSLTKEVTWKQVYTYWATIRECEPSAADVQAEAQELFNGVKQVEGVSLEISPATRYGYAGVFKHQRCFAVSFVKFKKTVAAGHRTFSDCDMVTCAYARALASMFDEGDASALVKLEALYCKRYCTSPSGRRELRRKVSLATGASQRLAPTSLAACSHPCTAPATSQGLPLPVGYESKSKKKPAAKKSATKKKSNASGKKKRVVSSSSESSDEEYAPESDS